MRTRPRHLLAGQKGCHPVKPALCLAGTEKEEAAVVRPDHTHKARVSRSPLVMLPSLRKLVGVHMATKRADISPLVSQSEHLLSINSYQTLLQPLEHGSDIFVEHFGN